MRLLMDEHVPPVFRIQLVRWLPATPIWQVGGVGAPPLGTLDPDILDWCETHNFVLVTNNRKSMPVHLADHLAAGRHIPGIVTIDLNEPIGTLLQELEDVVTLSLENEYLDKIIYLPDT